MTSLIRLIGGTTMSVLTSAALWANSKMHERLMVGCVIYIFRTLLICYLVPLGPFDGQVAAVIDNGHYFITSPNANYIRRPSLGSRRTVSLRSDFRYSDNDWTLWPQP